jgi:ABC-type phosphate/phosphonate transport system, ATPase component
MKQAARERDLTTIASLHQVNIAREFGDRFIGIRDGMVVFDGSRAELSMDIIDDLYYTDSENTPLNRGQAESLANESTAVSETSTVPHAENTSDRDSSADTDIDTGEAQL